MTFTESSTVEQMILDAVTRKRTSERLTVQEASPGRPGTLGGDLRPARWDYVPPAQIPRRSGDVMVEPWLRDVDAGGGRTLPTRFSSARISDEINGRYFFNLSRSGTMIPALPPDVSFYRRTYLPAASTTMILSPPPASSRNSPRYSPITPLRP